MASFLEQLEHAEMLLQTYRCPELEDVLTLLDTVLQAAELGSIQYESVVRIQVQRQSVRIDTEWRTRCHAEGMVKSEESKVYAKREPLWRTLRHERSECRRRRRERVHGVGTFMVSSLLRPNQYVRAAPLHCGGGGPRWGCPALG